MAGVKNGRRLLLRLTALLLGFVIPLILVMISVVIFKEFIRLRKEVSKEERLERVAETEEGLTPSQVLNNKSLYSRQKIVIRGKVTIEDVVCERKKCPSDDPCCGCPFERDLIILDPGVVLTSKTSGRLKLLDKKNRALCQRPELSCKYKCGDWLEGAIYDVSGVFSSEAPPPGWKASLEYYFQVEGKSLVRKVELGDILGNLWREIKEIIEKLKTSGYYILP